MLCFSLWVVWRRKEIGRKEKIKFYALEIFVKWQVKYVKIINKIEDLHHVQRKKIWINYVICDLSIENGKKEKEDEILWFIYFFKNRNQIIPFCLAKS
jgi:elongation factor P--beta-lysine ligase